MIGEAKHKQIIKVSGKVIEVTVNNRKINLEFHHKLLFPTHFRKHAQNYNIYKLILLPLYSFFFSTFSTLPKLHTQHFVRVNLYSLVGGQGFFFCSYFQLQLPSGDVTRNIGNKKNNERGFQILAPKLFLFDQLQRTPCRSKINTYKF